MIKTSSASIREATLLQATRTLVDALRFYRDSKWNDDYPGGIDVSRPNRPEIDTGGKAARALRDPHVRRVLVALGEPEATEAKP